MKQWNRVLCFLLFYTLIVIAAFYLIWLGFSELASTPGKGDAAGHYQNIYTKEKSESVLMPLATGEAKYELTERCCSESDQEKINNYRKDKRDLNAQEGMWRAANALVVLTFFQMIIGAITMWFLYVTFITQRRELRQATRTANAAEASEKCFLFVEFGYDEIQAEDEHIQFFADITNYGKTPAMDVVINFRAQHERDLSLIKYFGIEGSKLPRVIAHGKTLRVYGHSGGAGNLHADEACNTSSQVMSRVGVHISYKGVFDEEYLPKQILSLHARVFIADSHGGAKTFHFDPDPATGLEHSQIHPISDMLTFKETFGFETIKDVICTTFEDGLLQIKAESQDGQE